MSLTSLINDLNLTASDRLSNLGLTAMVLPSIDPAVHDHVVIFKNSQGRQHGVSLLGAVSQGATWDNVTLRVSKVKLDPIEGTSVVAAYPLFQYFDLAGRSTIEKIWEVIGHIEANNFLAARDDLDAGIVADRRFKPVVERLLEHFDGDVVFRRSRENPAFDTVDIVSGDNIVATAVLGAGQIDVTYPNSAGVERQFTYRSVVQFENRIGSDTENRSAPTIGLGRRP
jgi:hypothetical protein